MFSIEPVDQITFSWKSEVIILPLIVKLSQYILSKKFLWFLFGTLVSQVLLLIQIEPLEHLSL
jgi:hypothetical protein